MGNGHPEIRLSGGYTPAGRQGRRWVARVVIPVSVALAARPTPSESSVGAPAAEDHEQGVDDPSRQHEPQELAEARVPHARVGHPQEDAEGDRPVQQPTVAVTEAVQGDMVFAVEAQADVADRHTEADVQQRFEGVREPAAGREEVDGHGDQCDDGDVARGFEAIAHGQEDTPSVGPRHDATTPQDQLLTYMLLLRYAS
jgi:hypothetical protein